MKGGYLPVIKFATKQIVTNYLQKDFFQKERTDFVTIK